MFPMISGVEEMRRAKGVLRECRDELLAEDELCAPLSVGAMIETPAVAVCADELAREADFFSVGTNNLVQYTLDADRGNERLRDMPGAEHSAVVRLIEESSFLQLCLSYKRGSAGRDGGGANSSPAGAPCLPITPSQIQIPTLAHDDGF